MGRSWEALPLAREAARQAPWSPLARYAEAVAVADLGMCAEALAAAGAVDRARLPHDADGSAARLDERMAACER